MSYKPRNRKFEQRNRSRFNAMTTANARSGRRPIVEMSPRGRKILLIVLPIAVIVAALGWFFGDTFRYKTVRVQGNDNVPEAQIQGVSGLLGQHPLFVNANAAAQQISTLAGVTGVFVNCGWAGECVVTVKPAGPLAVWRTASGLGDVWVDALGKVQKVTGDISATLSIRVEEGDPPPLGKPLDARLMRAMNELIQLQPSQHTYLYSSEYGLMFSDERGMRVRVGVSERDGAMQAKLSLAQQLREQLASKNAIPRTIDVRFVDAPYYMR